MHKRRRNREVGSLNVSCYIPLFFSWKSQAQLEIRLQAETTFTKLHPKEDHRLKFAPNSHNKMRGVHDSLIANQQRSYIFRPQRSNNPFGTNHQINRTSTNVPSFYLFLCPFVTPALSKSAIDVAVSCLFPLKAFICSLPVPLLGAMAQHQRLNTQNRRAIHFFRSRAHRKIQKIRKISRLR